MPKPLAAVPDLEQELDALYALPPAEFTAARNDLARRLKQAGQAGAAQDVQGLRKPTVPVWTVNQLARRHGPEVAALLQASDELRDAQREALAGNETDALRAATRAQRDTLQALTHRAHELLGEAGVAPGAAVVERIASTLRAAAVDPDARERLESGRLNEELEAPGFGAFEGMPLPPARKQQRRPRKPPADARRAERLRKLQERARELEDAAREAEREAERSTAAAERARAKADRARAELDAAGH
ncbi:MAG TPA: hypothetical protein VFU26_13130 [Gaiellaceae bacterium]|nr:hypothetical protein [Gaiellaceae bacterium]